MVSHPPAPNSDASVQNTRLDKGARMSVQISGTIQMQLRSSSAEVVEIGASRESAQSPSRCDREPRNTAAGADNQKPSVLRLLEATSGKRAVVRGATL